MGDLKPDQRRILNAIFPLLAGFATFFIGGTALVKLTGNLGGLKVLFTGTAGVAVFVFVFLHPIFTNENSPTGSGTSSGDSSKSGTGGSSSGTGSTISGTGSGASTTSESSSPNNSATKKPISITAKYVTYAVSGSFQQGYSLSSDSTVVIDTNTGLEVSANITVVGPDGKKEDFVGKPNYNIDRMWQWQNQGSSGGSLDFQDQQHTFVRYPGEYVLSNSAYWTPVLGHNVSSADTFFRPIASSDTFPQPIARMYLNSDFASDSNLLLEQRVRRRNGA